MHFTDRNDLDLLNLLYQARIPAFLVEPDGQQRKDGRKPHALLAGSFNPLHAAHQQLAEVAYQLINHEPHFELSVCNMDKPPLSAAVVRQRLRQFAGKHPVWVTRAPTFADKARLFPGATFVVGADTAARIVAARYYAGGEAGLDDALIVVRDLGCRFLVAGRCSERGEFQQLRDLPVPSRFADLFVEIPQALFHVDMSSTELRDRS